MPLVAHLESLLPAPPARVLCLACPDVYECLGGSGLDLHRSDGTGTIEGAFGAIVWGIERAREEIGEAVGRLRKALAEGAELIVVAPLEPGEPTPSKRQGALPSSRQTKLREVVRHLSETGFTVRKDQDLRWPPEDARGPGGWKVLVARRDPFLVRSYRQGDEGAVLDLFRTCFPHDRRQLDHWRWKYAGNPHGPSRISLAVSPGGELAAHYGGYPSPVWRRGRSFTALVVGDTMTDESFRHTAHGRGGLLARTVRHFFSIHRDGELGFYYGFNTGPIQRFCRWFIGGSETYPVGYWARQLDPAPAWSGTGGYRIWRLDALDDDPDRLFRRVAPSYGFLTRRDSRYLDWRYRRCPDTRYVILAAYRWTRLVGWSVFRRRGEVIDWGDALFGPAHLRAVEPLLTAALAEPEMAGAKRIEAWFPENPAWWRDRVEELGFVAGPEPKGLGMVALGDAEPEAFAALGEMYYTMGDGDLF